MNAPLLSFIMLSYRQEDSVREALAQDYPNLEIIVSDDCSPDDIFAGRNYLFHAQPPYWIKLNAERGF